MSDRLLSDAYPRLGTRFRSSIRVLVYLTVGEVREVKQTQMVGIQDQKQVTKRSLDRWFSIGGTLQLGYPDYSSKAEAGFAEHDLDEYNRICAELAWSRSAATARRAFVSIRMSTWKPWRRQMFMANSWHAMVGRRTLRTVTAGTSLTATRHRYAATPHYWSRPR